MIQKQLLRHTAKLRLPASALYQQFSTKQTDDNKKLIKTSDFIHDRLYYPKTGYFSKPDVQLGVLEEPIEFSKLFGYEDYIKVLEERYPENAWLTPSEIFKPWYGMSIANYISRCLDSYHRNDPLTRDKRVKIIEVGAGNGSTAESILSYFKAFYPLQYKKMDFTIVEISPVMISRCRKMLIKNHSSLMKSGQIRFVEQSFLDYSRRDDDLVFVLLLEVLDNMPHDRVYISDDKVFETWVQVDEEAKEFTEVRRELEDPDIREVYQLYKENEANKESYEENVRKDPIATSIYEKLKRTFSPKKNIDENVFLPTYAYKMFKNIHKVLPKCHYIMSDFDLLLEAESAMIGTNAPVVSNKLKESWDKQDFDSYLIERGQGDIFFPTDFRLMKRIHEKVKGVNADHMKSYQFIQEYSEKNWAKTESGYNPLKEDFANTAFFLSRPYEDY